MGVFHVFKIVQIVPNGGNYHICLSNFGAYYCIVSPPEREGEILIFKSPNHSRGRGFYSPYGRTHPYKGQGGQW